MLPRPPASPREGNDSSKYFQLSDHDLDTESKPRNVFVQCDAGVSECRVVAGFWQHGHVTISRFYAYLSQVLSVENGRGVSEWFLCQSESKEVLDRQSTFPVPMGSYIIVNSDGAPVHAEPVSEVYRPRIFSGIGSPRHERDAAFRKSVMQRDRRCLISGKSLLCNRKGQLLAKQIGQVAHILPVYNPQTPSEVLKREFTSSWDCMENGLTMMPSAHVMFNAHNFAIDVDDNYRIIELTSTALYQPTPDGRRLLPPASIGLHGETICFLREHLHQTLLKHVKGDNKKEHPEWIELAVSLRDREIWLDDPVWTEGDGKLVLETYLSAALDGFQDDVDTEDADARQGTEWSYIRRGGKRRRTPPDTPPPLEPDDYVDDAEELAPMPELSFDEMQEIWRQQPKEHLWQPTHIPVPYHWDDNVPLM